jgi:hypothetical protein
MNATYSTNSAIQVFNHIYTYAAPPQVKFDAIVPTGWKTIILDGILDENNSVNSDTDDLTDWEEVVTDKLSWDTDGSVILPTVQQCINYATKSYAEDGLSRFKSAQWISGMPSSDFEKYLNYILNSTYILPIYSDPTDEDTDGDGLLDGTATYINKGKDNEKKVAPKDPNPFKSNGPENAWKAHIEQIENGENLSTDYSDDYYEADEFEAKLEFLWGILPYLDNNLAEVFLSSTSEFGSKFLDFRYDINHIALHADTTQWQSIGGYNDFYDWVFDTATSMDKLKLSFKSNGINYVVWSWKGNYLNLGAGSEVGFYTQNDVLEAINEFTGLEQWMVEQEFPMTLNLYKKVGTSGYTNYYNWVPDMEQWWITGFVPNIYDYSITADQLLQIASVDFSKQPKFLSELKSKYEQEWQADYLIFDEEENTLWIIW